MVLLPRLLPVLVKMSPFYHLTVLDQDGFIVKVVAHGSNLNIVGSDEHSQAMRLGRSLL